MSEKVSGGTAVLPAGGWGWAYACETTARITACSEGFVARIDLKRESATSDQAMWPRSDDWLTVGLLHRENGRKSNVPVKKESENTWKTTKEDALMDQDNLCFTKKKKKTKTQKTNKKNTPHTHLKEIPGQFSSRSDLPMFHFKNWQIPLKFHVFWLKFHSARKLAVQQFSSYQFVLGELIKLDLFFF